MKNIWLWIIGIGAVGGGLYLYSKKKATTAPPGQAAAAVQGGANNQTAFMTFLGQFGVKGNAATTTAVNSAFANLQSISAIFGGPATNNGVPTGNVNTPTSGNGPAVSVDTSGLQLGDLSANYSGDPDNG